MDPRISLCLALLFIIVASASAKTAIIAERNHHWNTEANKFFHSIPKSERTAFFVVSLMLGIKENWPTSAYWMRYPPPRIPQDLNVPDDLFEKFKNMSIPHSFRKDLVNWVMERFQLSPREVFLLSLRNEICLPDGTCFNTGDTGDLCCPF